MGETHSVSFFSSERLRSLASLYHTLIFVFSAISLLISNVKTLIFPCIPNALSLTAKPIDIGGQTHRFWRPNSMRLDAHVFSCLKQTPFLAINFDTQLITCNPIHFSREQVLLVSAVSCRKTKEVCQQFDTPRFYMGFFIRQVRKAILSASRDRRIFQHPPWFCPCRTTTSRSRAIRVSP